MIGIRGTDWGAVLVDADGDDGDDADSVGDEQLNIGVIDGGITVTNAGGSVELGDDASFSFAVVESFDSPPMPQAEPPAGLGTTRSTPLLESTDVDAAAESGDGAAATEQSPEDAAADDTAADDTADVDDAAEGKPSDDADASSDATAAAGTSGDAAADTAPLLELGDPEAGDTDVVFEYSNRCFWRSASERCARGCLSRCVTAACSLPLNTCERAFTTLAQPAHSVSLHRPLASPTSSPMACCPRGSGDQAPIFGWRHNMLVLTRRVGESIMVNDLIEVKVLRIKGKQVHIGIDAPSSTAVHHKEVWARIQGNGALAANEPQVDVLDEDEDVDIDADARDAVRSDS